MKYVGFVSKSMSPRRSFMNDVFPKIVYFHKITCFVVADDDYCAFSRVKDGYGLLVGFLPYV